MIMNIRVLTPKRVICKTSTEEVVLPGLNGEVGVLEGHATLVTALDIGLLRIKLENAWLPILLCGGGLAEIDNNLITVLCNEVEEFTDIKTLSDATIELEDVSATFDDVDLDSVDADKDILDASDRLKKASARVLGLKYLSKKIK